MCFFITKHLLRELTVRGVSFLFVNRLSSQQLDRFYGAGNQNRTDDLVITNDVLYRLSHTSTCDFVIIPNSQAFVKPFLKIFLFFSVFLSFFLFSKRRVEFLLEYSGHLCDKTRSKCHKIIFLLSKIPSILGIRFSSHICE